MTEKAPAEMLAEIIGRDSANSAIKAGWRAINEINAAQPSGPAVHPGVADYVATAVILAALPTLRADDSEMFRTAYLDVAKILDDVLGANEEDGTGAGLASNVYLLAERYKALRAAYVNGDLASSPRSEREREAARIEADVLARQERDEVSA